MATIDVEEHTPLFAKRFGKQSINEDNLATAPPIVVSLQEDNEDPLSTEQQGAKKTPRVVRFYLGVVLLGVALVCAAASVLVHVVVGGTLRSMIESMIEISPRNDFYQIYLSNDQIPTFNSIVMFNLTNPDQVLSGEEPKYAQLQPVVYQRHMRRFNISFSPDRNAVSFRYYSQYTFDRNDSRNAHAPDPHTTHVYNINPVYLGVMVNTGGESKLMRSMTGGALQQIMEEITNEFAEELLRGLRSFVLRDRFVKITDAGTSIEELVKIWSDSTTAPSPLWDGMLLSEKAGTPTNIPVSIGLQLFSFEDETGLMSLEPEQIKYWFNAYDGNEDARNFFMSHFNLTEFQLLRILNWFPVFLDKCVFPFVQEQHIDPVTKRTHIQTKSDMGWFQWGSGNVSPYGSVTEGPFGRTLPGYPEIYYFAKYVLQQDIDYDIKLSKEILNSTSIYGKPLFDKDNALAFLTMYDNQDFEAIERTWMLDKAHASILGQYMYYVKDTFINDTLIHKVIAQRIGLITKRTIHEWLMSYNDPLLALLKQPPRRTTLIVNDTSEAEVYETSLPSVQNTGHYNSSFIGQFLEANGSSVLGMWKEPVSLNGTDGRQFAPFMTEKSIVTIWNPERLRPQEFKVNGTAYHYNIRCLRIKLNEWNLYPHPVYYNKFYGMGNLTVKGSPIFISKWYWLDTKPIGFWNTLVKGVRHAVPDDDTHLDVEPNTGITLSEKKRFMLSAWIDNTTNWLDMYNKPVRTGIMYPIVLIDEFADIPEQLARNFTALFVVHGLQVGGFWVMLASFIIATVAGFALVFHTWVKSN